MKKYADIYSKQVNNTLTETKRKVINRLKMFAKWNISEQEPDGSCAIADDDTIFFEENEEEPHNSRTVQAFNINGLEVDFDEEKWEMITIPYEDIHVELLIEVLRYAENFGD